MLTIPPIQAATYYISTTGNDSNSCSTATNINTPKRSFMGTNGAMACLAAGDKLYVRGGTYSEGISNTNTGQFLASGTSWTNAITVAAYPNETVTLTGYLGFGYCCGNPPFSFQMSYWIFDGFRLNSHDKNNNGLIYNGQGVDHIRFVNLDITNNFATNANPIGDWLVLGGDATGMCISGSGDHFEFVNIEIHECGAYGVYFWGHDSIFDHVKVHDTYQYGLHIYHYGAQDVNNNIVRNSEVYNVHRTLRNGGPSPANGILLSSGYGNQAYNNVIHDLEGVGGGAGTGGGGISGAYGSTGYKIYNNTVYSSSDGVGISVSYLDSGGAEIKNNLVYGGVGFIDWTNVNPIFSNNLCSSSGAGCQYVASDPKFVNANAKDFHLQAASPAIDKGTTLGAVTTDRDGVTRPQGSAYDVGAYEYTSSGGSSACDMNRDASTNVSDVQLCVNQGLGISICLKGDINKDGLCNVVDVQRVANAAIGGQCVSP